MTMAEILPWIVVTPMALAGVWGVYDTFFRW